MKTDRKNQAGFTLIGGAAATVLVWAISLTGAVVPVEVGMAFATLIAWVVGLCAR